MTKAWISEIFLYIVFKNNIIYEYFENFDTIMLEFNEILKNG
jgi:hypothetical protein